MESKIVQKIIDYIDKHDILRDYETYEQMPVFYRYKELECLEPVIRKEDYTTFLVNLAIMYVNTGMLYAKKKLTEDERENYLIYFMIHYVEEDIREEGFTRVDVVFTRKASEHLKPYVSPINFYETKIGKYVKDIVGIDDFVCYYAESKEDEYEQFYFIPKKR